MIVGQTRTCGLSADYFAATFRRMAKYDMGDDELDRGIADLVSAAGEGEHSDLVAEIMTTALKLYRDQPDRGELKLFNTALKEMRYSALVFGAYRDVPKVTVFGSARTPPESPEYRLAHDFAEHMVTQRNWMVITGAGPGIMEAANKGAGPDGSFGVNIRLPFEAAANQYIPESRIINFKYFFTRKLGFVKESNAFTIFPGGFGTMDEAFELLTLIQTGKAPIHPIVLMEAGDSYWPTWDEFVSGELLEKGWIGEHDRRLYRIAYTVEEAAEEICGFYLNYHSQRYVSGRLIVRLRHLPTPEQIAELNEAFHDILVEGTIELTDASEPEIAESDALELARLSLNFNRRSHGRLREFINELNSFVYETPGQTGPIPSLFLDHFLADPD